MGNATANGYAWASCLPPMRRPLDTVKQQGETQRGETHGHERRDRDWKPCCTACACYFAAREVAADRRGGMCGARCQTDGALQPLQRASAVQTSGECESRQPTAYSDELAAGVCGESLRGGGVDADATRQERGEYPQASGWTLGGALRRR